MESRSDGDAWPPHQKEEERPLDIPPNAAVLSTPSNSRSLPSFHSRYDTHPLGAGGTTRGGMVLETAQSQPTIQQRHGVTGGGGGRCSQERLTESSKASTSSSDPSPRDSSPESLPAGRKTVEVLRSRLRCLTELGRGLPAMHAKNAPRMMMIDAIGLGEKEATKRVRNLEFHGHARRRDSWSSDLGSCIDRSQVIWSTQSRLRRYHA